VPSLLKAALDNDLHDTLFRFHQKYGKTLVLTEPLGSEYTVMTTDPENVKHILKTNFENYPKGPHVRHMQGDLLGHGIFNADGADWHRQRKTTSTMFTAKLFKEHIWLVVQRNTEKVCDILSSASSHEPLDVFNLMNRYTLDTIGEIGFGRTIGSLEDPSSPFLMSFDKAQQIVFMRFVNPIWPIFRAMGVGSESERVEHFGRLDQYSREIVRELREGINCGTDREAKQSFVGLFLADAQKRNDTISEDYLRDLVLNFLIAGRDTTAQALAWTFYLLCNYPEVESKAREEVNEVCSAAGLQYDDVNRMPYLTAIIHETLRLYPSVPLAIKYTVADDVWPDGTFVPAGANAAYNTYAMGRDKTIWGEDAEVFRPERWLEMERMPSNYDYPAFKGGPRECLGRRLAMIEMKMLLATLLPRFTLQLAVPADKIEMDSQVTIGMRSGLPCYVVPLDSQEQIDTSTAMSEGSTTDLEEDASLKSDPTP
jgi:fatty acid omega-hydroxylase